MKPTLTASTMFDRLQAMARTARERSRDPQAVAHRMAQVLASGAQVGGTRLARAEIVQLHAPGLTEMFGAALVAALRPQKLPPDRCRWCVAALHASVHRTQPPAMTAAAVTLLGRPCTRCTAGRKKALARRVARSNRAQVRRTMVAALTASGTVTARDGAGRPTRLRTAPEPAMPRRAAAAASDCACSLFHATLAAAASHGLRDAAIHSDGTWTRYEGGRCCDGTSCACAGQ